MVVCFVLYLKDEKELKVGGRWFIFLEIFARFFESVDLSTNAKHDPEA